MLTYCTASVTGPVIAETQSLVQTLRDLCVRPLAPVPSPVLYLDYNTSINTMPSSARGEALVGVPEVIDGTSAIPSDGWGKEGSLESRTRHLNRQPDLGPPDVVYIRKRFTPVVGASRVFGFYHFVRGVDVKSAASISLYLHNLVNKGLDPQTWVSSGTYDIVGATYRSFNALSKIDVVVDLKLPGGISAHGVDAHGTQVELTDDLWTETAVCAALRHVSSTGEHPLYPCLRVMQPTFDMFEDDFLAAAHECVGSWSGAGRHDSFEMQATVSNSRIAFAISEYLLSHCRYDRAIEFFSSEPLVSSCIDSLVHVANAHRLKNDLEAASEYIDKVLESKPDSYLAWIGRARIAKAKGESMQAFDAASKACQSESAGIGAFVTLADICADLKRYQEAFIALNTASMPQLELDYYLRDLVPNRGNKTAPSSGSANGFDAVNVMASRLKKERTAFNSKCDESLSELPGKMMTPVEHSCYGVLVKILNDVGWDKLLSIRGSAFVMETDIDKNQGEEAVNAFDNLQEAAAHESSNGTAGEGDAPSEGDEDASKPDSRIDVPESPIPEGLMDVPITPSDNSKLTSGGLAKNVGKVVCKPWLDYLVTVMYEDLRALAVWNAEERSQPQLSSAKSNGTSNSNTSSGSLNDVDVEAGASSEQLRRTPEQIAASSKRPAADWLRRGELALRLEKSEEAKSAFWTCIRLSEKAKTPAISARLNLMSLGASEGDAISTISCADNVWSFLDSNCDRKTSAKSVNAPKQIQRSIFNLTSKLGLRTVRETLDNSDVDRNRLGTLLLDAVSWKVHGYSM